MTKREKLGRYLIGVGVGIVIGVGQDSMPGKAWWWLPVVGIAGIVTMLIGFEMCTLCAPGEPKP